MANIYGIAKIGVSPTITDADVQYLRDTDLGISAGTSTTSINLYPSQGSAATIETIVPGTGYKIGKSLNLVQLSSTGNGKGLTAISDTFAAGSALIQRSEVELAGFFVNYQNTLLLNFDIPDSQYTYARTAASAKPVPVDQPGVIVTTAAIPSTSSGAGTGATFLVSFSAGTVIKVTVSATGSGYLPGDLITMSAAAINAPVQAVNIEPGTGNPLPVAILGDITLVLSEDNLHGSLGLIEQITVTNGGAGHTIGDTITLTEEGTTTGTGTVDIASLGPGQNTPGTQSTYPSGILNTSGTAGAIVVKDVSGNTVVLGQMLPGVIRPFNFSQVMGAGTGPAVGDVTILYGPGMSH
tara:strand:- start:46 stop:1104 length:1059 start_codon:yes stop_codon:yes gene_type:complete